jgi:hypothetical protein
VYGSSICVVHLPIGFFSPLELTWYITSQYIGFCLHFEPFLLDDFSSNLGHVLDFLLCFHHILKYPLFLKGRVSHYVVETWIYFGHYLCAST